jgi:hypothetical protein
VFEPVRLFPFYQTAIAFCGLGAFPWFWCGIVFCRNVENIILFARFLLRFVVMSMSLSIKALVRFLCMPYRLRLKNYFKKELE